MSGRIALVAHASFPADPRLRRQTDTLLEAGHEVDVIALRYSGQAADETDGRLRIVRVPVRRRYVGLGGHLVEYIAFATMAGVKLAREHRRRRFDLVQVATLPDFLAAAAGPLKLRGVPLLLDLHEDMPAFFGDRFRGPLFWPFRPLVGGVTRAAAAMADHMLTVHEPLRALAIGRGVDAARITVVMNGPDERIFDPARHPRRTFMTDGTLRLVHHSALQRIYGLEIALEALALICGEPSAPALRLDVYGEGPWRAQIERTRQRLGLDEVVELHGRVPLDDLPAILAASDIGLVPSLPEPYLQLSLSTKLLELAMMGVPVVGSDLATFRAHFGSDAIHYVRGGDPTALADGILADVADPAAAAARAAAAREQVAPYGWSTQAPIYLGIIDRLLDG
jgi:glycosyltransferase involved in cell wall biosynthesis